MKAAAPLFEGWEETLIYSCLQGFMGKLYVDNESEPASAAIHLGDFCFFAGKPDIELAGHNYGKSFLIMVPQNEDWAKVIETVWGDRALRRTRFAIKKEPDCFDREKLLEFVNKLPVQYKLEKIDESLYRQCLENDWSRDLVSQFPTYDDYKCLGLGMAVTDQGKIVCGASSYSRYKEGIEIEIDTREDYRRQGLATAAAAALILKCMEKGLYPSWDAQNLWSVGLAQKLGYTFDHEYPVYEVVY